MLCEGVLGASQAPTFWDAMQGQGLTLDHRIRGLGPLALFLPGA